MALVKGTAWMSMSGAVAMLYVNELGDDKGCCKCSLGFKHLGRSTKRTFFFHMGSVAFGTFIIALFRFIRYVFEVLDYSTRKHREGNIMMKLLFKCIKCCLYCMEKTVEFISNWGFIFVAAHGTPFCRSCFDAFGFQVKYLSQTVVNNSVQFILRIVIKVTITVTCAMATFFYLDGISEYTAQYNPLWAAIVVAISAWVIAASVCMIFDVSIDTIYLCAFEDMETNKAGGKLFMSDSLRKGFGLEENVAESEAGPKGVAAKKRKMERSAAVEPDGTQVTEVQP